MKIEIEGASPRLIGAARAPGDKSVSHRAALFGGIASGTTRIDGFLNAADCRRSLRLVRALGAEVSQEASGRFLVRGSGFSGLCEPANVLDVGNSGTTARLALGILAGLPFFTALTGDASLRRRPMSRVASPLVTMGARIAGRGNAGFLPLAITGRYPLHAGTFHLPVPSAQLKSALLLAGLRADGETAVSESLKSRDHSERMLAAFGAQLSVNGTVVRISPGELAAADVVVPGDISSAAFIMVGATILAGSDVLIRRVGVNITRTGVLDVLRSMGADIQVVDEGVSAGEPWADLRVTTSELHGVTVEPEMAPRLIDEVPVLVAAACFAQGVTEIRGVGELRVKESDRLTVLESEFRKLGATVETGPDWIRVLGGRTLQGGVVKSHGDHRIAMTLILAGLKAKGRTSVLNTGCIATSYPEYLSTLAALGAKDALSI